MAETATPTKRGNPNLIAKSDKPKVKKGIYVFKLTKTHDSLKPKDKKTGETVDNPYPPLYYLATSGQAMNEKSGQIENWRFLHGYNSIWEKDQQNPKPDKARINNVDGKNDLTFRQGFLRVKAHEEAKLQALMVQDGFEGNHNKIVQIPDVFGLIEEDKVRMEVRKKADKAFEAESAARSASYDEMLAVAMALGINIQNDDEEDIRTQFIFKAKNDTDTFLKLFNDPRPKIKYHITRALAEGTIQDTNGVITFTDTREHMITVKANTDIAEQIAVLAASGEELAKTLYDRVRAMHV